MCYMIIGGVINNYFVNVLRTVFFISLLKKKGGRGESATLALVSNGLANL